MSRKEKSSCESKCRAPESFNVSVLLRGIGIGEGGGNLASLEKVLEVS